MNFIINMLAKLTGAAGWISAAGPLLGAAAGILAAAAHIAGGLANCQNAADYLTALKGVAGSSDAAAIALGVGMIRQHFQHQAVAAQVAAAAPAQADAKSPSDP